MQRLNAKIQSIDITDSIAKNPLFRYILESKFTENSSAGHSQEKECLNINFINNTKAIKSNLYLSVTNSCQFVLCSNFHTFFTVGSLLGEAALKEKVDVKYYKDFAKAALAKLEELIQMGMSFAVSTFFSK